MPRAARATFAGNPQGSPLPVERSWNRSLLDRRSLNAVVNWPRTVVPGIMVSEDVVSGDRVEPGQGLSGLKGGGTGRAVW